MTLLPPPKHSLSQVPIEAHYLDEVKFDSIQGLGLGRQQP